MIYNRKSLFRVVRLGFFLTAAAFFACEQIPDNCGRDARYDPATQFCFGGKAVDKCGTSRYNPNTEGCFRNNVYDRCDGDRLVPRDVPCEVITYTLATTAAPESGGRISRTPDYPGYEADAMVAVTADPANGYTFVGWAGAVTSTDVTVTLTMDRNKPLVAMFNPISQSGVTTYTLTATAVPEDGGSIVRTPYALNYNAGTEITLTATPERGYTFVGWSGASTETSREITITMDSNKPLVAMFEAVTYTLTANVLPLGGGTVSRRPNLAEYDSGAVVTITANAEGGYVFTHWTGEGVANANSAITTVSMTEDRNVTANFQQEGSGADTYTLTAAAEPAEYGSVSRNPTNSPQQPNGVYTAGRQVTVTATANTGYRFTGWSGTTLTGNPLTVTMNNNINLIANFEEIPEVTVAHGSFTDLRDGQGYRTVRIGDLVLTWMAENLNYVTDNSWCYDTEPYYCGLYGRLYDWNAAMSACQGMGSGWRLPTRDEWGDLAIAAGGTGNYGTNGTAGTKLKARSPEWNGTDEFGFSALPGGWRIIHDSPFDHLGRWSAWWSATERGNENDNAYSRSMDSNLENVRESSTTNKSNGYSVRCVRDD